MPNIICLFIIIRAFPTSNKSQIRMALHIYVFYFGIYTTVLYITQHISLSFAWPTTYWGPIWGVLRKESQMNMLIKATEVVRQIITIIEEVPDDLWVLSLMVLQ